MYIMRDNLYPSSIGPGYSGGYGPNYINISGSQEGRINPTANYTKVITVRDSYVQVGNAVTHTVTYPYTQTKTVTVTAKFADNSSGGITTKLQNLVIPISEYTEGTAAGYGGSATFTLPSTYVEDPTPTYTKSKAPTNIELSPSRVYDGDTVTISCSGGSPGQNLEVSGYQFFLKYVNSSSSSTPSTPTGNWDSKLGQAWPEVTKTLESGHEGQYLAVRAQLQVSSSVSSGANVSQYHSDLSRAFYFKINSNINLLLLRGLLLA